MLQNLQKIFKKENKNVCYHCGGEANYYSKHTNKWRCNLVWHSCPGVIKKKTNPERYKVLQDIKKGTSKCYICGKTAKYIVSDNRPCCSIVVYECPEYSKSLEGHKLKKQLNAGKAKCYICDEPSKYIVSGYRPCCSQSAHKCPGYNEYAGKFHDKYYKNNKNYYHKKKRPLHSKALLKENEFGTLGGYGYYHAKAHGLFGKDNCTVCGKSNKEELEYCNKGLIMHCRNENFTDLSEENWRCVCSKCHKLTHKLLRRVK